MQTQFYKAGYFKILLGFGPLWCNTILVASTACLKGECKLQALSWHGAASVSAAYLHFSDDTINMEKYNKILRQHSSIAIKTMSFPGTSICPGHAFCDKTMQKHILHTLQWHG